MRRPSKGNSETGGDDFEQTNLRFNERENVKITMITLTEIAIYVGLVCVRNGFNIGIDNSDKDGWNRSGLRVRVGHAAGVNYFTTWSGKIILRVNKDGSPFISETDQPK